MKTSHNDKVLADLLTLNLFLSQPKLTASLFQEQKKKRKENSSIFQKQHETLLTLSLKDQNFTFVIYICKICNLNAIFTNE